MGSLKAVAWALVIGLVVGCGASYWVQEAQRAETLQQGAVARQEAAQDELAKLEALVCNGHADRYATRAGEVLEVRAAAARGEDGAAARLAAAERAAEAEEQRMDAACKLAGIQPAGGVTQPAGAASGPGAGELRSPPTWPAGPGAGRPPQPPAVDAPPPAIDGAMAPDAGTGVS